MRVSPVVVEASPLLQLREGWLNLVVKSRFPHAMDSPPASSQSAAPPAEDCSSHCAANGHDLPSHQATVSSGLNRTGALQMESHEAASSMFEVNVKCVDGTVTKLEVGSNLRGVDLKELIQKRLDVPADRQRLIFRGHVVNDEDLVGQHITESGQTLHMVQRPTLDVAGSSEPGAASSENGAATSAPGQTPPQLHFQFATTDGGAPLGMPQFELSQLLGSVFGTVGRGGGIGLLAPFGRAQESSGAGQSVASVGIGRPRAPSQQPQPASGDTAVAPATANVAGSVEQTPLVSEEVTTSSHNASPQPRDQRTPDGGQRGVEPPPGDRHASSMQGASTNGAMALQPLQIIFQQGLGNLAHVLPAVLGEAPLTLDTGIAPGARAHGGSDRHSSRRGHGAPLGDSLPWRDLRRLSSHLNRLLGRPGQGRLLPPTSMPNGELHAFRSLLITAIRSLSVALADLQISLSEGVGQPPRQRLQFAMALASAARTLRGLAMAMQAGFPEGILEAF